MNYTYISSEDETGGWLVEVKERPRCFADVQDERDIISAIKESQRMWTELRLEGGSHILLPNED